MWAREDDRDDRSEALTAWRCAGRFDAERGHALPAFGDMKGWVEADGERFTLRDYAEYCAGYADHEEGARVD
jgi:hypothetical protein